MRTNFVRFTLAVAVLGILDVAMASSAFATDYYRMMGVISVTPVVNHCTPIHVWRDSVSWAPAVVEASYRYVLLSGSAQGGFQGHFYDSSDSTCSGAPVSRVKMLHGSNSVTFYFKDSVLESGSIQAGIDNVTIPLNISFDVIARYSVFINFTSVSGANIMAPSDWCQAALVSSSDPSVLITHQQYLLDGSPIYSATDPNVSGYQESGCIKSPAPGRHVFTIMASDQYGYSGYASYTFTVNSVLPASYSFNCVTQGGGASAVLVVPTNGSALSFNIAYDSNYTFKPVSNNGSLAAYSDGVDPNFVIPSSMLKGVAGTANWGGTPWSCSNR